jgi:hypothetical protein
MECSKGIGEDTIFVKRDGQGMGVGWLCLLFSFIDDSFCLKYGCWKRAGGDAFDLRSRLAFLLQSLLQLRSDLWNIFLLKAFDDDGAFVFTGLWIRIQFNREFVGEFMKAPDDILHLRREECGTSTDNSILCPSKDSSY